MNLSGYNLDGLKVLLKIAFEDVEFYKQEIRCTKKEHINFPILQSRLQLTKGTIALIEQEINNERFCAF